MNARLDRDFGLAIGFGIAGGVAVGAGVAGIVTAPREQKQRVGASPWFGAHSAGLSLTIVGE